MILRSVISWVVSSSAALAACALLCITSCAVHEWPEPSPADVIVNLDFDTQLPQYKVLNEEGTRASHDGRDRVGKTFRQSEANSYPGYPEFRKDYVSQIVPYTPPQTMES